MTGLYYVSTYNKFPIYEAAEGGYYYDGASVLKYRVFQTRRKAMKYLRKCFKQDKEFAEFAGQKFWNLDDHTEYGANGEYVGDGWYVRLERKLGEDEHGWQPYC